MPTDEQAANSTFKIKVEGSPLTEEVASNVSLVRVTQVHDGPHSFEFHVNPNSPTAYPQATFNVGCAVEIEMGLGTLVSVFKGLITQVEMAYPGGGQPVLQVAGYDKLHKLTRGRFTEHWESVKYSDVVSSIAGKCGLSASTEDTGATHKYVAMNNQTYFSFVMDMARRVGFEVTVNDTTLNFKPPQNTGTEVATLQLGHDVHAAKFKMQSAGQVTEVQVLGYEDGTNKQIKGVATSSDVSGSKTGPSTVNSKFGKAVFWVGNYSVTNQAEADKIAKGVLNQIADEYCTVEAECEGNTALKAAVVVKFDGVMPAFVGNYYVVRVVHEISAAKKKGPLYSSKVTAVRNNFQL